MRIVFSIQDASGHSTLEFGPDEKVKAEATFAKFLGDKSLVYARDGDGHRLVRKFDDLAEENVVTPQLVGG